MAEEGQAGVQAQQTEQLLSLDSYNELAGRVRDLEARVQASTDLTDDLIAQANTVVTAVGDIAEKSMQESGLVVSGLDLKIGIYLAVGAVLTAVISTLVAVHYGKDKADVMEKAIGEFTKKVSEDEGFRHEFVSQVVKHPNLRTNLQEAIDVAAADIARSSSASSDISEDIT